MRRNALLALADGTVFEGQAIGSECHGIGEVVFNTAMTGYQEILTDPSYAKQIVTLTVPHVGNTGVNSEDEESSSIHAAGLVIRDLPLLTSSFRSEGDLESYLISRNVAGIADIDTRQLTRLLREKGAQSGVIDATAVPNKDNAIRMAQEFAGLVGMDLAQHVTTDQTYHWQDSTWELGTGSVERSDLPLHVVAYDYGIKKNILRMLVDAGCRVTVVNARTPASEVLRLQPDGVFLSNGPGDPEPCDYAIEAIREILGKVPVFGICLGHQLLALASGAKTEKMKFGHHGANHPVVDLQTREVMISSQNHGFAVSEQSLPPTLVATHRSLFDGTLQGVRRTDVPAFGFQGHPEASPGPHDLASLFTQFTDMLKGAEHAKA